MPKIGVSATVHKWHPCENIIFIIPFWIRINLGGNCFAWHVQVSLGFYFKFNTEEIVHSELCAMWHLAHNSIFYSARIKIPYPLDKLWILLILLSTVN